MDPILQVLLSWQFILFGLAVAMVMYVFRLVVEYVVEFFKGNLSTSKLWNELILPIAPIVFGVLGALLVKNFPYPGFTPDVHGIIARGDRIIFGLVSGGFSTIMYRVVKALLVQKIEGAAQAVGVTVPTATPAPAASGDVVPSDQISSRGQL